MQTFGQIISIDSKAGYEDDVLCTYKFEFSVNAGPGDLMQVEFVIAKKSGL